MKPLTISCENPIELTSLEDLTKDIGSKSITILSDDHKCTEFMKNQRKILSKLPLQKFRVGLEYQKREDMQISPLIDIFNPEQCYPLFLRFNHKAEEIPFFLNVYFETFNNQILAILGWNHIENTANNLKYPLVIVHQTINGILEDKFPKIEDGIYIISKKENRNEYLIKGNLS